MMRTAPSAPQSPLRSCAGTAGSAARAGAPAADAAQSAPVDLTGYWVSVVSEDWRHRMATPRKGDYESLPLNAEGRRVAERWDLDRDNAAGLQCKAFGVGGLMRQPGRMHITWEDDDTLRSRFRCRHADAAVRFAARRRRPASNLARSLARRVAAAARRQPAPVRAQIGNSTGPIAAGGGGRGLRGGPPPSGSLTEGGSLKVATTGFREGYLRKNGVPYSEAATITEYFHRLPQHASGDVWLHVLTIVEDPRYLTTRS